MKCLIAVGASLGLTFTVLAQDATSGPQPGMSLTAIRAYAPIGPLKGKEFDAAAAIGKGPGAVLFVKALNRETAPIIRALDDMEAQYQLLGFTSFTIVLDGDRTAAEATVKRSSRAMRMRNPMCVTLDGAEGPGNYAIDRSDSLTLVIVKGGVVKQTLRLNDTGQKDIPKVRQAIESVTGPLPKTPAEFHALLPDDPVALKSLLGKLWQEVARSQAKVKQLQERNQRGRKQNRNRRMAGGKAGRGKAKPKRKFEGKAPDDPKLKGYIRSLIQKDNDAADLDRVFAGIESHVGADEALRHQVLEAFKLILSLDYGTDDAKARARAYRKKHLSGAEQKRKD